MPMRCSVVCIKPSSFSRLASGYPAIPTAEAVSGAQRKLGPSMWMSVAPRSSYDDVRPAPLVIDVSYPDPDTVVVTPDGEVDLFTAPDLQQALRHASSSGRSRLLVDLDRLTFIDAATLGVLVEARLRISAVGGTLQVRSHTRHRRLLFLTGLEAMLHGCR